MIFNPVISMYLCKVQSWQSNYVLKKIGFIRQKQKC